MPVSGIYLTGARKARNSSIFVPASVHAPGCGASVGRADCGHTRPECRAAGPLGRVDIATHERHAHVKNRFVALGKRGRPVYLYHDLGQRAMFVLLSIEGARRCSYVVGGSRRLTHTITSL